MTPQDFIEDYLGCSAEELCNWGEKVDKLPWAGFAEILDWMEEYGKQQWNEAIKLATEKVELNWIEDGHCELKPTVWKESILKLLKP